MGERAPRRAGIMSPASGTPFLLAVFGGVCAWLILSFVAFAGFLGCVLAGYLHRSSPFSDAFVGGVTAVCGLAAATVLLVWFEAIGLLPASIAPFRLAAVIISVLAPTPLAIYIVIGYLAFTASFGALMGAIGGYMGSGGYGSSEDAHRRAISVGQKYRGPGARELTVEELLELADEHGEERPSQEEPSEDTRR